MTTRAQSETPEHLSDEVVMPPKPSNWGWVVYIVLFALLVIGRLAVQTNAGLHTAPHAVPTLVVQPVQNSAWPHQTGYTGSAAPLFIQ